MLKTFAACKKVRVGYCWLVEFEACPKTAFRHRANVDFAALKMFAVVTIGVYALAVTSLLPLAGSLTRRMADIWRLVPIGQRLDRLINWLIAVAAIHLVLGGGVIKGFGHHPAREFLCTLQCL